MARPKNREEKPLTETELQIMNILWSLSDGTVHDVLERLTTAQGKDYAYTTVSTLLRVLEKKQVVASEKEGRGHRYYPAIDKERYQQKTLDHVVSKVFAGKPTTLIKSLLGQSKLSKEELEEVKKILDGKAKK